MVKEREKVCVTDKKTESECKWERRAYAGRVGEKKERIRERVCVCESESESE
jgi:hypothetical protein